MRGRGAPKATREKLYHSTLSKTPDGVKLRFTSDTKDSQYPDSAGYVFAESPDGMEIMFVLENDDIRSAGDGCPQKKWVTVRGEGKGAGAWIIIDDDDGPILPESKPRQAPAPRQAQETPEGEWQALAAEAADIAALVYSRLETHGHPLDSAGKASVFSTLFIAMDRRS